MTPTELKTVLENHAKWLANVSPASRANLSGASLSRADLRGADLYDANLSGADLSGADLSRADLRGADLSGADLYDANLSGADLYDANLSGADLYDANLYGAILFGANLFGANLSGANLRGAELDGSLLVGTKLPDFQICPQNESFIGYKKVRGTVLKLRIEGPRTNSLVGRKCRTSKAFVLEALDSAEKEFRSLRDQTFIYRVGQYVEEPLYDPDIRVECTNGIHFFMTEEEARAY